MSTPSLSTDGERVLGYRTVSGNVDVWAIDLRRSARTRLTSDAADDVSPCGRRRAIAWRSRRTAAGATIST